MSVALNGKALGEGLTVSGKAARLRDGENTITVTNGGAQPLALKQIAIAYSPDIRSAKPGMALTVADGDALTLSGLSEPLHDVYDVTGAVPSRLVGIENIRKGATWSARFAVTAGHRYELAQVASPERVSLAADRPSDLATGRRGADYVVIAPAAFEAAAKRLALHRASQGLRVEVVDVADVFDEFSYGEADPAAIRRFLAHAYARWSPGVRQAVLFGDGVVGCCGGDDTIPVHVEVAGALATASDSWYGCVDGADALPDIQIGRLPVSSFTEAQIVVQKLIQYDHESSEQAWAKRLLIVGGGIHVPPGAVEPIAITDTSELLRAFGMGGLCATALAPGRLNGIDGLVSPREVATLRSQGGTPLLISPAIAHGYYASPTVPCLTESLMSGRGGISGGIVNSGLMDAGDALLMTRAVLQAGLSATADAPQGFGALLDVGRLSLAGRRSLKDALRTCLLIGDPATVLKAPSLAGPAVAPRRGRRDGASGTVTGIDDGGADSAYALIWQVLAQGKEPEKEDAGTPAGLDVTLKATMVDTARPFAVVCLGNGRQRLVRVGDRIEDAEVVAIQSSAVVLRIGGRTVTITLRQR